MPIEGVDVQLIPIEHYGSAKRDLDVIDEDVPFLAADVDAGPFVADRDALAFFHPAHPHTQMA